MELCQGRHQILSRSCKHVCLATTFTSHPICSASRQHLHFTQSKALFPLETAVLFLRLWPTFYPFMFCMFSRFSRFSRSGLSWFSDKYWIYTDGVQIYCKYRAQNVLKRGVRIYQIIYHSSGSQKGRWVTYIYYIDIAQYWGTDKYNIDIIQMFR